MPSKIGIHFYGELCHMAVKWIDLSTTGKYYSYVYAKSKANLFDGVLYNMAAERIDLSIFIE